MTTNCPSANVAMTAVWAKTLLILRGVKKYCEERLTTTTIRIRISNGPIRSKLSANDSVFSVPFEVAS